MQVDLHLKLSTPRADDIDLHYTLPSVFHYERKGKLIGGSSVSQSLIAYPPFFGQRIDRNYHVASTKSSERRRGRLQAQEPSTHAQSQLRYISYS